jgi:hypothetical protein
VWHPDGLLVRYGRRRLAVCIDAAALGFVFISIGGASYKVIDE